MIKRIFSAVLAAMLIFAFSACGKKEPEKKPEKASGLVDTRWYADDVNNTIRTVAKFGKDNKLTVNYVELDPGRAERTELNELKYTQDEYYYRDLGNKLEGSIKENAGDKKCAFEVYYTKEDFEGRKSPSIVYYNLTQQELIVDGAVCKKVQGDLAKELDEEIKKNMEVFEGL